MAGKVFKTKTGYCHIFPEKIVLSRDGVVGNLAEVVVGNSVTRVLITYSLFSCGLLYFAYTEYQENQLITASAFGLFALLLVFGILNSLNNSAAPVVFRSAIVSVKFKKAIPGLIRSHFVVRFVDELGRTKKRLIMLPGSMSGGSDETEKALKIMKEEKLIAA